MPTLVAPAPETTPVQSPEQTPPTPDATPAPDTGFLNDPELDAHFADPFEKIDEKVKTPKVEEKPKEEKKPEATPDKPKVEAKKDDKKDVPTPKDKPVPKELKEHNEKLLNELKEERRIRQELEKKYSDAESKGKDTAKLAAQIAAKEKEISEIKGELSAARFSVDDTFQKTYVAPLARKVESVKSRIGQFKVIVGTDEATNEVKTRQATFDDVMSLYNMTEADALEASHRLFGPVHSQAINSHLSQLHDLADKRDFALQEERGAWEKQAQERETTKLREKEAIGQMWEKVNSDLTTKHPEWFGENPDDPEGNELLREGYRLVDSAYNGDNLTPQQKVILDANIRNRAAAFARDQHAISKLNARIAELEEKMNGKKQSQPGAVRREGGETIVSEAVDFLDDPELKEAFKG